MLRRIGLIGGMSWESTATYYRFINQMVRARHGGLASADLLLHSLNFREVVDMQVAGRWDLAAEHLAESGRALVRGGAECVLICTNTMHLVADEVEKAAGVPLIHIIDATGNAIAAAGFKRPLLLATRYTMEHGFYRDHMMARCGIEPITPEKADRDMVHDIIFSELCCGVVKPDSRQRYLDIIEKGRAAGADCVILGCTEIGLLIEQRDVSLPVFDSTWLHAEAAVNFAEQAVGKPIAAE
ncbi:MAG: aspartate/glutamate racemase family protein [Proteobacteria bacterium]|nr:aspartate/glutamate racemase family protein [Pseudomonadota bacterium]